MIGGTAVAKAVVLGDALGGVSTVIVGGVVGGGIARVVSTVVGLFAGERVEPAGVCGVLEVGRSQRTAATITSITKAPMPSGIARRGPTESRATPGEVAEGIAASDGRSGTLTMLSDALSISATRDAR